MHVGLLSMQKLILLYVYIIFIFINLHSIPIKLNNNLNLNRTLVKVNAFEMNYCMFHTNKFHVYAVIACVRTCNRQTLVRRTSYNKSSFSGSL